MESDEDEEESEGEREKLQLAAVTASQVVSTARQTVTKSVGTDKTGSVLARRLGQWIESHYDLDSSMEDCSSDPPLNAAASNSTLSTAIFLISSSQNPVTLTPPPPCHVHTAPAPSSSSPFSESSSSSEDEEGDKEEKERLLEAAIDPSSLLSTIKTSHS